MSLKTLLLKNKKVVLTIVILFMTVALSVVSIGGYLIYKSIVFVTSNAPNQEQIVNGANQLHSKSAEVIQKVNSNSCLLLIKSFADPFIIFNQPLNTQIENIKNNCFQNKELI
jgi:hypothetical protein